MTPRFERPRRAVVKVGSSSLRDGETGGLDGGLVRDLAAQLARVRADGTEVVLVSSGAVAAGLRPLGLDRRPVELPLLQAAASVGQGLLVHAYQEAFAEHGLACGQVLLTPDDVVDRTRYLNARHTFDTLLELGAVPVVNENDTVATDELRFGDNDRLAALVASMLGAQLLVLLSDVEGLHDGDPATAPVLERVDDLSLLGDRHVGPSRSGLGRGGMASKVEAARIATFSGAAAVIARAHRPDVVTDAVSGAEVGTWFPPSRRRPESRKLWIAFAHVPTGAVVVDAGAERALIDRGSSLLAAGVRDVAGAFRAGEAVDVLGEDGRLLARGLSGFAADEVRAGGLARPVIHRDALVVLV